MGTLSSKLPELQDYTATITMANQKQVVRAFPDNVVSVSMDDTHMMVGLENGAVGVVLRRNLFEKFVTEPLTTDVNEGAMITAVCCDTFDVRGQSLFYAGDSTGFLHVIGENGVVIDSLKVRDDPIIAIQDVEARKVWVFSDDGRTVVVLNNNKLEINAQRPSKWSMSEDGQVFPKRNRGAFGLEEYECTHPARFYGTPRINIEAAADNSYAKVAAFGVNSGIYKDLVEDNKVIKTLEVTGKNNMMLKTIDFEFPVKQVFSSFVKNQKLREDAVYVLTTDDKIYKYKATELADKSIDASSLDRELVFHDPNDKPQEGDLGDIETFTVRDGLIVYAMKDSSELYQINTKE